MEREPYPEQRLVILPPIINPVGVFDVPETAVTTEPPFRRTYVWRTVPPWGD